MKLHYLTNVRLSNLVKILIFLFSSLLLTVMLVQAQTPLPIGHNNISTSTYLDYIIPDGIKEIRITLTGGRGGFAEADVCRKIGGKGAQVAASFFVGNNLCANNMFVLKPGGTLRILKGGDGKGDFTSGDDALGSGGGGSAALYLAPNSSSWQILLVAGGGGGAAASEGLIGTECLGFDGKNAELNEGGSNAAGNNFGLGGSGGNGGGAGGVIDGDGGGGGGAYTDGADGTISGIGGDKGGTTGGNGGNSSLDGILRNGGFGFGGGGAGRISAGGGGGYSGGGGGGKDAYTPGGGGGGGSFVIAGAFNVIKTLEYSSAGLSTNTVSGTLPLNKLYVKKDAVGSNDGSSWTNAFVDLQDALAVAANNCLTEIWVAKGTYYPDEVNGQNTDNRYSSFIMKSGVKIYGGFSGNESNLSQRNWSAHKTYLSGDLLQNNTDYDNAQFLSYEDNAYHVVRSENNDNTSVLDGLYIQSGNANGTGEEDSGGGIYMNNSGMTLINCEISFNHAYQGSGIYLLTSSPLILNCYIKSNKAISGGAGVYNNTNSSGYFYNCVFHANQVGTTTPAGGGGGAIVNYNNSNPDFVNCTISGNDAKTGGAVYNLTNAHPNFYNTIIWNNKSVLTLPISTDGSSSIGYFHCLVQGIDLSASNGNLDGSNVNNSPFMADADLDQTPIATGDLQLKTCSEAIDKGGEYFDQSFDVMNNPRIVNNVIDLGAFEKQNNLQLTYYFDNDNDGLGDPNNSTESCEQPTGYVTNDADTDDNCAGFTFTGVYPDFDGDGYGSQFGTGEYTVPYCDNPMLPGGFVHNNQDCNDANPNIKPGATEICDGLDNDCDGQVDEGFVTSFWYLDEDGDGHGDPSQPYIFNPSCHQPSGYVSNSNDCDDSRFQGNGFIVYVDNDGDGYHGYSYTVCTELTGSTTQGSDCNDGDKTIHAGAIEICDYKDNDCDGLIDEESCSPVCSDETAPAFTGSYTEVNLGCNPANPDGSLGTATATDASGSVTITSTDGSVVIDGCTRSKTRTFTAVDACGNIATILRRVSWIEDLNAPVFTGSYADEDLGCNPANPGASLGVATATDACGSVTISSADGIIQSTGCNRTQTRTFTAKDGCGNTSTTSRTIKWTVDTKAPEFTRRLFDRTIHCNLFNYQINNQFEDPEPTDACGDPTLTYDDNDESIAGTCMKKRTRIWTATDACGNTATNRQSVTWSEDDRAPTFTGTYSEVILEVNPSTEEIAAALGSATATDFCGNPIISSVDGAVQSNGCTRSQTRKFTARDACSNTSTVSRTVIWTQGGTPTFTGTYTDINLDCNPAEPAASLGTATATDACGIVTITHNDGDIAFDGCNQSQTRTFKAMDGLGNTSTVSRTVRWTYDKTGPTITPTGTTLSLGCNPTASDIEAALGTATGTDACGTPTVTSSDGSVTGSCIKSQTRTFTAKDGCGNTTTASRIVTWTYDKTAPSFTNSFTTVPLGCNPTASDIEAALGTATATDACGVATITSSDGSVTGTCLKSQTRTFTAKDACGNTTTASRIVTWTYDKTAPSFTSSFTTVPLGCNPTPGDIDAALGNAMATDACGVATITSSDGSVSGTCLKSQTRTFTAKDACGNTSTASRTVTWKYDKTAPSFTSSFTTIPLEYNPTPGDIEAALGTATATDACGVATVTSNDGSVTGDCLKTQARTFTAKDGCGNTSTALRTVTWKYDLTAPTINGPSSQTVYLGSSCTASLSNYISLATASDNCTPTASITITQYPVATTLLSGTGPQTVTLKATDAAGNTATCSFTVNKVDNAPPVINNASPSICVLSPPNHKMRDVKINYSLTDNCGGTISSVLSVTSDEPINGTGDGDTAPDWEVIDNYNVKLRAERSGSGDGRVYTITIKATDASGNTTTSSVEVRVAHNITSPKSGQSFKVGSTVNFEGEFWDKVGNKHTATWLIDDNTTVKGTVTEPTATKNGKVTGSYKFTVPGVYKLQMNTKDQNNVVSYANTSGDLEAIIVIYDPNGGYTYGGGYFNSPAGAVTSNPSATGKGSYGFSVNYFKGATYPKGETQFEFKVGEFEFNALNFEYMSIAGARAQMKGTGKIIGGQSGINFILTVTDGQLDGSGIDRIRMKVYNKNTMEVYYDNQPGASDALNPTTPVQETSTVVISGTNVSNLTQSNQVTTKLAQESAPFVDDLEVKAMPNPSNTNFRIVISSKDLEEPVKLIVSDMLGRIIETRITTAGQIITVGDRYRSGTYAVRIVQGKKTRQLKLIKIPD